ncbi:MAG: trypsin-like serine protease [Deltaproteobacteria bacterium]|nr:trypsin-like serine protease [Deltaproteobacteria bacterium]
MVVVKRAKAACVLLFVFTCFVLTAASGCTENLARCEPKDPPAECTCPTGAKGKQQCNSSRSYEPCDCTAAELTPAPEPDSGGVREGFIVGGQLSRAFAATGALRSPTQTFCTGTLVTPTKVLTAAHCVYGQSPLGMEFVLGSNPRATEIVRRVKLISTHDLYQFRGDEPLAFDVAVLDLQEAITNVEPAVLSAAPAGTFNGRALRLVGYGKQIGVDGAPTGTRAQARIIVSRIEPQYIVYAFRGEGACNGDSGGPAFLEVANGDTAYQVGVTSKGTRGCQGEGFYQRLDITADWLRNRGVPFDNRKSDCSKNDRCDGACDKDEDCYSLMCPSGSCTVQGPKCLPDGKCDEGCGNSDPDCGTKTDLCEVYGLYRDGRCTQGCPNDPECTASGGSPGVPSAPSPCIPSRAFLDFYGTCHYYDAFNRYCGFARGYCGYWGCVC